MTGTEFGIIGLGKPIEGKARVVRTFSEASPGEPVLVLASTGCLDLAVCLGSASERFGIQGRDITLGTDSQPRARIELQFSRAVLNTI